MAAMLGYFPGHLPGFGGLGRQPRQLLKEWGRLARRGRFQIDALPGVSSAIAQASIPVLAFAIEGDRIATRSSVEYQAAMFATAAPEIRDYTSAEAGGTMTHITWVKRPAPLVERIDDWVCTRLGID
jgi:predicted alpha/beta hydrolase